MSKTTYRLVYHSIVEGYDIETVRQSLSKISNTDPQKLHFLSGNKPVTIKKNLDFEAAVNQKKILEKIGVFCQVESADKPDDNTITPNSNGEKPFQQTKKIAYTDQGISYTDTNSTIPKAAIDNDKLSQKDIDLLIESMAKKN